MIDDRDPTPASDRTKVLPPGPQRDTSLGALLRRFVDDARELVRLELDLARNEIRIGATAIATSGALIAGGALLLLLGFLVLTVFVILALGRLLGGQYWLSTLIVGSVFAGLGAYLLLRGRRGLQADSLKPELAIASVQEDGRWARAELAEFKDDLTN